MTDIEAALAEIAQGEGQRIEFKQSLAGEKKAIITLCAFAHRDGGTVFFGVKDNGEVVGTNLGGNTLENLANNIRAHTDPPLTPSIERLEIDCKAVVDLCVQHTVHPARLQPGSEVSSVLRDRPRRETGAPVRVDVVGTPVVGRDIRFAETDPGATAEATILLELLWDAVQVRDQEIVNVETGERGSLVGTSVMEDDPADPWRKGFLLQSSDRFSGTFLLPSRPQRIRFEVVAGGQVCTSNPAGIS